MKTTERAKYPDVLDRIGENPARFLDAPIVDDRGRALDGADLAVARIRGIRSVEVVEEWVRVEADLDRGPRPKVMALLNQKKAALEGETDGDDVDLEEVAA